jgi:hypothetical protein
LGASLLSALPPADTPPRALTCIMILNELTEISDPYFYIPKKDLAEGILEKIDPSTTKCYWLARLSAGGKTTERILSFDPSGPLENLVRIEVSALGK